MMKMRNKLLLLLMLTGLVLAASVTLSEADEKQSFTSGNDTYNFYFQKAPGPTTVNQGSAPTPPQDKPALLPDGTVAPAKAESVAKAEEPTPPNYTRWELYAGFTVPYKNSAYAYTSYRDTYTEPLSSQYLIGLQYNPSEDIGIFGEYMYLGAWPSTLEKGSRTDWALGGNFTPIHIRAFNWLSLNLSGNAGVMSGPFMTYGSIYNNYETPGIQHKIMPFLGVRASLHIARKVAVNANARALTGFNKLQTSLTASYFF